jgi:hypothetical protein
MGCGWLENPGTVTEEEDHFQKGAFRGAEMMLVSFKAHPASQRNGMIPSRGVVGARLGASELGADTPQVRPNAIRRKVSSIAAGGIHDGVERLRIGSPQTMCGVHRFRV